LDEYLKRADSSQESIYYIAGESQDAVAKSPLMEQLNKRGLEVVYMVDPIDEYLSQSLQDYEGKKLVNIAKEGLKFGDEDEIAKQREEYYQTAFQPLTAFLKDILGNKVEKVVVSNRLANSPCVLVTSQYGWTANMERIMKAQALADPSRGKGMTAKRILEINPFHPIVKELNSRVSDSESVSEETKDLAQILYDSALLSSGFSLEDNTAFVGRVHRTINIGLGLDADAPLLDDNFVPPPKESKKSGDDEEEEEHIHEDL